MNDTFRRTWPTALVVVVAVLYIWIGAVAPGWNRLFGIAGGLILLGALIVAQRSVPAAMALLAVGALPLAISTWWSIATPVLAILALLLGWFAVRSARQPRRGTTSVTGSGSPA
jgi:uncharacterized membrane protein YsdA (DUF1294 family)